MIAISIHLLKTFLIPDSEPTLVILQWDKALTKIPAKYSDYANIFSIDLAIELLENVNMNEHAIKLIERKQPFYELIYALDPM